MTSRRSFLLGSAAALVAAGLPLSLARAQAAPGGRKFVFVFNPGGWDPTRVFAPEFGNRNVSMEADAARATAGGIAYVDHPARPAVRAFFEQHHARSLVLNGVMVRSIAHGICTMIALTGSSAGTKPDWPAILGAADQARYTLPHLVLDGPSFPGDLGVAVARTGNGGQLESLLSGRALDWSDEPVSGFTRPTQAILDDYLHRRASARADAATSPIDTRLAADFRDAHDKAARLKDLQFVMDFDGGAALASQANVAVEALSLGLSRCVSIAYTGSSGLGWDTHANNDPTQSDNFEGLFQGLGALMRALRAAPGETAASLADETVVVVMSEMGRTPLLNAFTGKDHWPYTSVLLVGPGITGDRVVGGYDDSYYGLDVDPASGDVAPGTQVLSAEAVGATLLAMADVDPDPYVSGVAPLTGVLT